MLLRRKEPQAYKVELGAKQRFWIEPVDRSTIIRSATDLKGAVLHDRAFAKLEDFADLGPLRHQPTKHVPENRLVANFQNLDDKPTTSPDEAACMQWDVGCVFLSSFCEEDKSPAVAVPFLL